LLLSLTLGAIDSTCTRPMEERRVGSACADHTELNVLLSEKTIGALRLEEQNKTIAERDQSRQLKLTLPALIAMFRPEE